MWHIACRNEAKSAFFMKIERAELGIADADSLLQHGLKHGLQIAGRTTDDLKNLRCGRLLLQRFGEVGCSLGEIACSLAQFVEQSRVLDGDDGLRGAGWGTTLASAS